MKISFVLIVVFISLLFSLNAQQLENPFMMIYYPVEYNSVKNFIHDSSKYVNAGMEDAYGQSLGTLYSYLANYEKAEYEFVRRNTAKGYIPEKKKELSMKGLEVNQKDLTQIYSSYNVVLFNEAHHTPMHRAFVYSQLATLKNLGFTQLALEALNEKDTLIMRRRYPISNYPELITGVYTNDPVYGNLIRKALALGFELIPYDTDDVRREKGQARNIMEQFDQSKGKLIVLGGYGHIEKKFPMMGYHLQKGLDEKLVSISQTRAFSIQPLFPKNSGHEVYMQKDSSGLFDYRLYFNIMESDSNIPTWYSWMDYETILLKKLVNKPIAANSLIQLYIKDEINGVPVFQYLSGSNNDIYIAYPQSGDYILKITHADFELKKGFSL